MGSAETLTPAGVNYASRLGIQRPVVVEATNVSKTFRIPSHRVDSMKERVANPFRPVEYRELNAVKDVTFDIRKGEFFGIVGRNGSGKSTLLKILSSIYRPDNGKVRMAGQVAPFIELGVGFNPDLTAKDNCLLNGVLMGLTRKEAEYKFDSVIDFAGLQDFEELKLKNYSSGMTVRLAFSCMVQADADIMLIDEVLAVGDAQFAQKCMDVFHEKKRAGKTIVLVTHDMTTVQAMCHRAMLLHDGEMKSIGDPAEVALEYTRLNFQGHGNQGTEAAQEAMAGSGAPEGAEVKINVRPLAAALLDEQGAPMDNLEQGQAMEIDVTLEAARDLQDPLLVFQILSEHGWVVCGFAHQLEASIPEGGLLKFKGGIENRLIPGRYTLDCWIKQDKIGEDGMFVQPSRLLQFVVYGGGHRYGVVSMNSDIKVSIEKGSA